MGDSSKISPQCSQDNEKDIICLSSPVKKNMPGQNSKSLPLHEASGNMLSKDSPSSQIVRNKPINLPQSTVVSKIQSSPQIPNIKPPSRSALFTNVQINSSSDNEMTKFPSNNLSNTSVTSGTKECTFKRQISPPPFKSLPKAQLPKLIPHPLPKQPLSKKQSSSQLSQTSHTINASLSQHTQNSSLKTASSYFPPNQQIIRHPSDHCPTLSTSKPILDQCTSSPMAKPAALKYCQQSTGTLRPPMQQNLETPSNMPRQSLQASKVTPRAIKPILQRANRPLSDSFQTTSRALRSPPSPQCSQTLKTQPQQGPQTTRTQVSQSLQTSVMTRGLSVQPSRNTLGRIQTEPMPRSPPPQSIPVQQMQQFQDTRRGRPSQNFRNSGVIRTPPPHFQNPQAARTVQHNLQDATRIRTPSPHNIQNSSITRNVTLKYSHELMDNEGTPSRHFRSPSMVTMQQHSQNLPITKTVSVPHFRNIHPPKRVEQTHPRVESCNEKSYPSSTQMHQLRSPSHFPTHEGRNVNWVQDDYDDMSESSLESYNQFSEMSGTRQSMGYSDEEDIESEEEIIPPDLRNVTNKPGSVEDILMKQSSSSFVSPVTSTPESSGSKKCLSICKKCGNLSNDLETTCCQDSTTSNTKLILGNSISITHSYVSTSRSCGSPINQNICKKNKLKGSESKVDEISDGEVTNKKAFRHEFSTDEVIRKRRLSNQVFTVSSDDEDMGLHHSAEHFHNFQENSYSNESFEESDMDNFTEPAYGIKSPTHQIEGGAGDELSELENLTFEQLRDRPNAQIDCYYMYIGTYRTKLLRTAIFVSSGIRITVTSLKDDTPVILNIPQNQFVELLYNISVLPVFVLYLKAAECVAIRNKLGMIGECPYYDSASPNHDEQPIIIFPETITSFNLDQLLHFYGNIMLETDKDASSFVVPPSDEEMEHHQDHPITNVIKLFAYPPHPSKGAITITTDDYCCLEEEQFLNDIIIDFYLKWLMNTKLSLSEKRHTHIFSTFFYKSLTATKNQRYLVNENSANLTPAELRHSRVRTWTKDVDIFAKDFIIIPINERSHWFLAIICFPGLGGPIRISDNCPVKVKTVQRSQKFEIPVNDDEFSDRDEASGDEEYDAEDQTTEPIMQPCILIFDSLAGPSRACIIATLREYLTVEYKSKKGGAVVFTRENCKGSCPPVPQQNNLTDCGIFTLQFAEHFFLYPFKDYTLPINNLTDWFQQDIVNGKREAIADLLRKLIVEQHPEREELLPNIHFNSQASDDACAINSFSPKHINSNPEFSASPIPIHKKLNLGNEHVASHSVKARNPDLSSRNSVLPDASGVKVQRLVAKVKTSKENPKQDNDILILESTNCSLQGLRHINVSNVDPHSANALGHSGSSSPSPSIESVSYINQSASSSRSRDHNLSPMETSDKYCSVPPRRKTTTMHDSHLAKVTTAKRYLYSSVELRTKKYKEEPRFVSVTKDQKDH